MNIALCGIGPHFIENLIEPIKSIFQEDNLIVYSRSITSAEEKAKELNISNFGSTLIRDLESRKIGMVISAIPPSDLGLEVVNCSLRNSTPVFVEKPLCISNEDLLEIQNDLKPNSILQVGYNYSNEEIFAEFCNECKVNSVENFRINFDTNKFGLELWGLDFLNTFIFAQLIHTIDIVGKLTEYQNYELFGKSHFDNLGKVGGSFQMIGNKNVSLAFNNYSDKFTFNIVGYSKEFVIELIDFQSIKVKNRKSKGVQISKIIDHLGIGKSKISSNGYYRELFNFKHDTSIKFNIDSERWNLLFAERLCM